MLERMGFQVLVADSGPVGLELFRTHAAAITCTLLDLTMPHMNGEEVFRELRLIQPAARVVIMSGVQRQRHDGPLRGSGAGGLPGEAVRLFTASGTAASCMASA